MDAIRTYVVSPADFESIGPQLAEIVANSVNGGAAISFMQPYAIDDGLRFWREKVFPDVENCQRVLFVAYFNDILAGTVQLAIELPPNQPHRCEVAKMIVHERARRRGVARSLMLAAEGYAKSIGKSLITLDTRTGDAAEHLYVSLGYQKAGIIPHYAYDPDGRALHSTTYMYKEI